MRFTEYLTNARQNPKEADHFIRLLQRENVRSFLEVGSKVGGMLWKVANSLPRGSRIVSVDLPWGNKATQRHLEDCTSTLKKTGYDTHLFLGDSTDPTIIEKVRALGPFDAIFIDANHTLPYVIKDWENYGPMGRIVAFHDISWYRAVLPAKKLPIEVPKFWMDLKATGQYRTQEITETPGQDNGIGVVWR